MSSSDAFLTHATRAERIAQRGSQIVSELLAALRLGALEDREKGDWDCAADTDKLATLLENWWVDQAEVMADLVQDYCSLTRETMK